MIVAILLHFANKGRALSSAGAARDECENIQGNQVQDDDG